MEEEISLRELIEVILKGKWIIASVTIAAMLIAGVFSYFIIKPTYESKATLLVNSLQQEQESPLTAYLNESVSPTAYMERLKSQELLARVIKNNNLNLSLENLKNSLTIENEKDTPVLSLTLKGEDPEKVQKLLEAIIKEAPIFIGEKVSKRLNSLADQYKEQLESEDLLLQEALVKYNNARAAEGLPTIVILDAVTQTGKQYILNVDEKYMEELRNLDKNKQVEFQKLNNQVNTLTDLYNQYSKNYEEARSTAKLFKVDNKFSVLSEPEFSDNPVSPRKALNVAIAMVIGLMVSVGFVFLRHYWVESGKENNEGNVKANI
jgi:chain length determinant protein (polysaccharide antigen chain regulator)